MDLIIFLQNQIMLKKILIVLVFGIVFCSCEKNYSCRCSDTAHSTIISTTSVTAKNAVDASSICIGFETPSTSCYILQ